MQSFLLARNLHVNGHPRNACRYLKRYSSVVVPLFNNANDGCLRSSNSFCSITKPHRHGRFSNNNNWILNVGHHEQKHAYATKGRFEDGDSKMARLQDTWDAVLAVHRETGKLDPIPPYWSQAFAFSSEEIENRHKLRKKNDEIVQEIVSAVEKNKVNPSGKHGRFLSVYMGLAMKTYINCAMLKNDKENNGDGDDPSIFEACQSVLDLLEKSWNIDLQAEHYECAILAAVRENRYREASELFWKQMDPDCNPIDISIPSPVGLYAIARHSQEEQSSAVVEQVLDAVQQMCMISPRDQEKYVLAAGTALGHAGEWMSFLQYLEKSYNPNRFGQPLLCAVMYACLLCNRHDEALNVFDVKFDGGNLTASAEYQWGGKEDQISPLARDLAMRAMGHCSSERPELSVRAMKLFRQTVEEDGLCISMEALEGVVGACEADGNWEDAVSVLFTILDHMNHSKWIVPGEYLSIPEALAAEGSKSSDEATGATKNATLTAGATSWQEGEILSSIMRTCNSSGKFGVALLCSRLFESYASPSVVMSHQDRFQQIWENEADPAFFGELEKSLFPLILGMGNMNHTLTATMVSLNGLGCSREAIALYEMAEKYYESSSSLLNGQPQKREQVIVPIGYDSRNNRSCSSVLPDAYDCYRYMLRHQEDESHSNTAVERGRGSEWYSTYRHLYRLIEALARLRRKSNGAGISPGQRQIFEAALARTIHSCTVSGQPETGICLYERVESELLHLEERAKSLSGAASVKGILSTFKRSSSTSSGDDKESLISSDPLLASTIKALRASNKNRVALDLFRRKVNIDDQTSIENWVLSCNATVMVLVDESRTKDAVALLGQIINSPKKNSNSCTLAAKFYADDNQWNVVTDLYNLAAKNGCLSEELGILAMRAAMKSDHGQSRFLLRAIRSVTQDLSRRSGVDADQWIKSRYWKLKQEFGFTYARTLMWWKDPVTAVLQELQLALEEFEKRKDSGLQPKNDITQLIISNARSFSSNSEGMSNIYQKLDRREVPNVPWDRSEWIDTLMSVIREDIEMRKNAHFIDEVALVFRNLQCNVECIEFVEQAIARGVRVRQTALREAYEAACEEGMKESAEHFEILL